jgi:plastocyanin
MRSVCAVAAVLVLTAAACSDDPVVEEEPASATPTASVEPSEAPEPDEGDDDAGRTVTVANFLFQPRNIRVDAGDAIDLQNTNPQTPHTFTVPGEDIDVQLAPQTIESVSIDLDPGVYPYVCRFHERQGMKGTLEVS